MRPSRRVRNRGTLHITVSSLRHSVDASVSALTRRGTLGCQRAKGHTFGAKPNLRCHRDATSMIIANLFLGRTSVLRSEEHTSELQSLAYLVCRLLLEKKK